MNKRLAAPLLWFWPWILLCLLVAALPAPPAAAQEASPPAHKYGLGIGSATIVNGLDGKVWFGATALQAVVGVWGGGGARERFGHFHGLGVGVDYLFEMPPLARAPYFVVAWSFGPGAGFAVQTVSGGKPALAVSGVAGLEFRFTTIPLELAIEYRPTVGLLPDVGIALVDFTGHLRVTF